MYRDNKKYWSKWFQTKGWYIADTDTRNIWDGGIILVIYRIENKNVSDDLPRYLYHVTPQNNLYSISRIGLSPRRSSKLYKVADDRVYFRTDKNKMKQVFFDKLSSKFADNPPFGRKFAILKIDTRKLRPGTEFEVDPEMLRGKSIYTRSNIPPSAIVNLDDYKDEIELLKRRTS